MSFDTTRHTQNLVNSEICWFPSDNHGSKQISNSRSSACSSTNFPPEDFLLSSNCGILNTSDTIVSNGFQKTNKIQETDLAIQFQEIWDQLNQDTQNTIQSTTIAPSSPTGVAIAISECSDFQTEADENEEFRSFVSSLIESHLKIEAELESKVSQIKCGILTKLLPQGKFKCQKCGKGYHYKSHLNRHTYISHSEGDISVKCPICGKKLAHKYTLRIHRRPLSKKLSRKRNWCRGLGNGTELENDSRKSCAICGEKFVHVGGYNRHMKMKHPTAMM